MSRVRSATPAVIRERYSIAPSIAAIQFAAYRTLAHATCRRAAKTIGLDALAQNAAMDCRAQSAGLV